MAGLLAAGPAIARIPLRAITGDQTPATLRILEALKHRFAGLLIVNDVKAMANREAAAIYFAIGPAALVAASTSGLHGPVLSLFTSRQTFEQIVAKAAGGDHSRAVTAIYAEASPDSQLRLIAAIFQRRVSVGVLLTPATAHLGPLLARAARDVGLEINVHHAAPGANIVRELNRLSTSDVLLAIPDASLYSADSVQNILASTYRRGQPIVGLSQGLVGAGALASAYASAEDIAAQSEELLDELEAGRIPEARYPAYWRVAVNDSVARSLNIVISDEARSLGDRPPPDRAR